MRYLLIFALLIVATILETGGDAIIRFAMQEHELLRKIGLFALAGIMLFGYGAVLVSAPVDFGKLLGLYICVFFVAAQIVNLLAFKTQPTPPILLGGLCILTGGTIISLWK